MTSPAKKPITKAVNAPKEVRPEPGPKTRDAIAAAVKCQGNRPPRTAMRYRLTEDGKPAAMEASHSDQAGWWAQLNETFGTGSRAFSMLALADLGNCLVSPSQNLPSELRSNFALAAIGGIAPKDEFEALIASQLVGTHALAMDCINRAMSAETMERRESMVTQATKMSRTFASLTEAMAKHRTGGKQQVEVRYVYVDARGAQNIIQAGGGSGVESRPQPYGPAIENNGEQWAAALPHDPTSVFAPMFGAQSSREPVPITSAEGPQAMSVARREQPRRPQGTKEWSIPPRVEEPGAPRPSEGCRRRQARSGEIAE